MAPIDVAWHRANPLPRNPSQDDRLRWHLDHAEVCGCRPMPAKLAALLALPRCSWARGPDVLMLRYHDTEWGVPAHDERRLFEMLILEGAQAGLSWRTILAKREAYRRAFDGFDPTRIARYDRAKVARLLADAGIVRNRLKIEATITNARALLALRDEGGSLDRFVWEFVGGRPRVNRWRTAAGVPARTPQSDAMSKALKARGFRFVGSTICYAFMQACGLVDDHARGCFRARQTARSSPAPGKRTA